MTTTRAKSRAGARWSTPSAFRIELLEPHHVHGRGHDKLGTHCHERRAKNPAPSFRSRSSRTCARGKARRAGTGRCAICRRHYASDGRADRPRRPERSDRAPVRARSGRACRSIRGAGRPDRRQRAQSGRRHCAPLSRPCAAQAHPCLRGLLPLLLPARDGWPCRRTPDGASARRRARLYRGASRGVGGRADRRRSAGALGRAGSSRWCRGSQPFRTSR